MDGAQLLAPLMDYVQLTHSLEVLKADPYPILMPTSPGVESDDELVSLLRLKDAARKLLPAGSITRSVIIAEPNTLPLSEALSKFKVFDRLLVEELGSVRRPR